jgi:hypothetical protein
MEKEILALAVLEPHIGREDECLNLLREFYDLLKAKGYSQDLLFRDVKQETTARERFVHLRIWASHESRDEAMQDPEVHRYWMKLPELCTITTVYETLERLYTSYETPAAK